MFESALIARAEADRQLDLGLILETIFFYRSTHLLLNHGSLVALAEKVPRGDLLALLERTATKLTYIQPNFAVVSAGMPRTTQFVAFKFAGRQERKVKRYTEEISMMLERALGSSRDTRKFIKSIIDRTAQHKFPDPEKETIITKLSQLDASDQIFMRNGVATILKHLVPTFSLPQNFRFELIDTGQGYAVDTNLDFAQINSIYHLLVPPSHSTISTDYLLAHFITARADSYFAANYMSEIVTAPVYSDLIRLKHFEFLTRRNANEQQMALFQDTVLRDFPRIGQTINAGERSISEFLKLLDQAERFKDWLGKVNPDEGLIRCYYKAATEKTWADKLPTKSVRFAISTGLGILADAILPTGVGTAAGVAAGSADALYLDRLIRGWRPNQFIESAYTDFVRGAEPNE